jgi:hypothetical protein
MESATADLMFPVSCSLIIPVLDNTKYNIRDDDNEIII